MSIPLDQFDHAYGAANDVPSILAALQSDDDERRSSARFALTGNVYHQGSRYTATYPTCRALVEIAERPETPEKDQLWELIRLLAVDGCPDDDSPERDSIIESLSWTIDESTDEDSWAIHDCYLLLCSCTSTLIEAIRQQTDHRLAASAAFVLAFVPWHAQAYVSELMKIAFDDRRELNVRSSCLLAACRIAPEQCDNAVDRYQQGTEQTSDSSSGSLNIFELALLTISKQPWASGLEKLKERYVAFGWEQISPLYPAANIDFDNIEDFRPDRVPPGFPWGDLSWRLRSLRRDADNRSEAVYQAFSKSFPQPGSGEKFDKDRYPVAEADLSEDNIRQAIRRYHYNRFCGGAQLSQEHIAFQPFMEQVPQLGWPTIRELLNHDDPLQRSCATDWCSNLRGLLDEQIDELLDQLIHDSRKDLVSVLGHQSLSRVHCLRLTNVLQENLLEPSLRSVCLGLWRSCADEDLLDRGFESFPESERTDILRTLGGRGTIDCLDKRYLKVVVSDLQSENYGHRVWAEMLVRKNESAIAGLLRHKNSISATEQTLLLRQAQSLSSISRSLQQDILAQCEAETDPDTKRLWLGLVGQFEDVQAALLDWIEAQHTASLQKPDGPQPEFEYCFVILMARMLEHPSVRERALTWLFERSESSTAEIRRQARRCVVERLAQEDRDTALKMIDDGLSDSEIENRRDSMLSLYRIFGSDVAAIDQRLEPIASRLLPGDRQMVFDLAESEIRS